jgi:multidrug efflux pump subunit AcrA (membrane-fusion protein)
VIPVNAVQKGEVSDYVYIAINQGGKSVASRRNVTLGLSQGDNVEVVSGLQSGDRLITSGLLDLSEGQEVAF